GDFSGGSTGWTTTAPPDSSISYAANQLTAVSDDDGTGTDSRTYASQSLTNADPGFLSWFLVSFVGTDQDVNGYDYPTIVLGSTFYWINTGGGIQTTATGAVDNDDSGITNLTVRTTLTAGTRNIGAGVTATDSRLGAGTAIWDDIDFQEVTQSPSAQVTDEDVMLIMAGSNAAQVPTNSGLSNMVVTISVTNGTLTLASISGITITAGSNGSSSMTFNGTPAAINTALDGLNYAPIGDYNGADTLAFTVTAGALSDTDNIAITVNPVPDYAFSVSKLVDLTNVSSTSTLNYTINISNTGDTALINPVLIDTIVQDGNTLSLTSAPSLQSATDADSDGEVDPGETWQYLASYLVTQSNLDNGNDIVNTASFNADDVSPQDDVATTTLDTNISLTISKVADDTTQVIAGQTINYTYVVTNNGNQTVNDVVVLDSHNGNGVAPVPQIEMLTADAAPGGDSTDSGTDEIWDVLAPGDEVTFSSSYIVTQQDVDTLQ
ncbi:MAG: hypothetical protein AAGF25_12010, partial [Pseudomonadota bacterium]